MSPTLTTGYAIWWPMRPASRRTVAGSIMFWALDRTMVGFARRSHQCKVAGVEDPPCDPPAKLRLMPLGMQAVGSAAPQDRRAFGGRSAQGCVVALAHAAPTAS